MVRLLSLLLRLLGSPRLPTATSGWRLDLNNAGRLILSALGVPSSLATIPLSLLRRQRYGSTVSVAGNRYSIPTEDYEILLALRERDPEITEEGHAEFETTPRLLRYFRDRNRVTESSSVASLQVHENSVEPHFTVDFDPESGAHLSSELRDPRTNEPIEGSPQVVEEEAETWWRVSDDFFPAPELGTEEREWLNEEESTRRIELEDVPEFFARDLALLRSNFSVVLTDEAAKVQVAEGRSQGRTVTVDEREVGWLDFDVEYDLGDLRVHHSDIAGSPPAEEFTRIGEYSWASVDKREVKEVEDELEKLRERQTGPHGYRIPIEQFQSLEEFIDAIGGQRTVGTAYAEFLENLGDFELDPSFPVPDAIETRLTAGGIRLRGYQREGVHWLTWLRRNHLHGLLADDMGLGKTLQALVALGIAYVEDDVDEPSLVVVPRSVMGHWRDEAAMVLDGTPLRVELFHGPNRSFDVFNGSHPSLVVSTYGTVRSDVDRLRRVPFYGLILDEATNIKNPSAQRTKAVKSLNAGFRLGLSGTPIENHLGELWSIFDFLMSGHLGTRSDFRDRFQRPIEEEHDTASQEELKNRIDPFLVRRTKDEVLRELPEKIVKRESVELTEEQRALYGQMQDRARGVTDKLKSDGASAKGVRLLNVLEKLKQICVHPALIADVEQNPVEGRSHKFDLALSRIREIVDAGDQVVLFSQYLDPLSLMERALDDLPRIRIDGSTQNRQELIVEEFNEGQARLALCSTRAASHGINLQHANHVIHLDFWWNPAVKRQATDRVHRIGQNKSVYVHEIWVEGTLEERIKVMLERKSELADRVIEDVSSLVDALSAEELIEILSTRPS